jgi:hypothetical protein
MNMRSNEFRLANEEPGFKYDENKVYARYVVEREFGGWSVVRRNTINGQGWTAVKYYDEQLANHVAWILNQTVDQELK